VKVKREIYIFTIPQSLPSRAGREKCSRFNEKIVLRSTFYVLGKEKNVLGSTFYVQRSRFKVKQTTVKGEE